MTRLKELRPLLKSYGWSYRARGERLEYTNQRRSFLGFRTRLRAPKATVNRNTHPVAFLAQVIARRMTVTRQLVPVSSLLHAYPMFSLLRIQSHPSTILETTNLDLAASPSKTRTATRHSLEVITKAGNSSPVVIFQVGGEGEHPPTMYLQTL